MIARLFIGLLTAILTLALVLVMLLALPVQLIGIWLLRSERPRPRADYYGPPA